jgi:Putative lactococcus lactis phage r1t holin
MSPTTQRKFVDFGERAVATFAQSFLAIEIIDQNGVNQVESLKVAAVAGGLAMAKYVFVKVSAFLNTPEPTVVFVPVAGPTPTPVTPEPVTPVATAAPVLKVV